MKKVFGIILTIIVMTMVIVMVTSTAEETVKGGNASEVMGWTETWCRNHGVYEKYDRRLEGETFYAIGVVDMDYFKELTGQETWSIDSMNAAYLSEICPYDVNEVNTKVIGNFKGYNVYEMTIKTNSVLGTTWDGIEYYCGSIIFMVVE